jgi:hypothetical protein
MYRACMYRAACTVRRPVVPCGALYIVWCVVPHCVQSGPVDSALLWRPAPCADAGIAPFQATADYDKLIADETERWGKVNSHGRH